MSKIGNVNFITPSFRSDASAQTQTTTPPKTDLENDKFEKDENANNEKTLTKREKQEIIKKANATASGWAIFFPLLSTAYFALRSDKTIADKYNLDVNKDKDFISEIKETQTLWTLPSVLVGISIIPYLYNKCRSANNININN